MVRSMRKSRSRSGVRRYTKSKSINRRRSIRKNRRLKGGFQCGARPDKKKLRGGGRCGALPTPTFSKKKLRGGKYGSNHLPLPKKKLRGGHSRHSREPFGVVVEEPPK